MADMPAEAILDEVLLSPAGVFARTGIEKYYISANSGNKPPLLINPPLLRADRIIDELFIKNVS